MILRGKECQQNGYYVNPSAESFAAIARSKSGFYQYCKSNIKQKKIQEVSIKTAFTFLAEGKHIVSFVGAGGKSSLIDAIAKWSSSQGKKVLVTTTTHISDRRMNFSNERKTVTGNLGSRTLGGGWSN